MRKKMSWKSRSMAAFSAGTLIVGAVLITLAVREAERERLAWEGNLDRERQRYATLFSGEVDSLFSGVESKLASAIAGALNREDISELSEFCRRIAQSENLVGDIFLLGQNDECIFPLKNPLIFASERKRQASRNLARIEKEEIFRAAEKAELVDKDLPEALLFYRRLLDSAQDKPLRALVWNRLGRCYLKSGSIIQALRAYQTILAEYSNELSDEGVPLGIYACSQICLITRKTEPEKAEETLIDFFGRLVGSEWPVDRSQFKYWRDWITMQAGEWIRKGEGLQERGDAHGRWEQLERQAEAELERLAAEEDLIEKIIPLVRTRLFDIEAGSQDFIRFSETIENNLFLISAYVLFEDRVLGFRMNHEALIQDRFPSILGSLPFSDDWLVQITDPSGGVIVGDQSLPPKTNEPSQAFVAGFAGNFPPWLIRIFQKNPLRAQKQLNLRRNIYILIVVLVIAVLFFGGFAVIRSTSKELELARLKSEFVATVSHEFRTPLMSIRYLSEMLDAGRVKGEIKKRIYYGKINKESERLSRIIENMLDFSKIEAGMKKYMFENLSVQELMAEVSQRFREYVTDKSVTLDCEIPESIPEIFADKEAMARALFNLLDNAVKYSGARPHIFLRAGLDGDSVMLEVEDRGAGLSKEEHKKVFEKFYRSSDQANKNIEGSGIGLTLVEHIAKAHGGDVRLESEPGKGTRVTIFLPLDRKGKNDG